MTFKTPLEQYHALFAPYFAEYAALPENSYDIDASTDVTEMLRAAQDHGLEVCGYPEAKSRRMILSAGRKHVGFAAAQPSLMRPALMAFCADKLIQKTFYARSGIAHAPGFEVTSREDAVARWRELGRSVVLKPVQGRQGIGVSVGVSGDADVARAFDYARAERAGSRVLMEQTCIGSDLRVIVLGRKVVCCYLKLPPNVTGDGTSCIADLVTAKNAQRTLSPACVWR